MSSRRFQPADSIAKIKSTLTGLTQRGGGAVVVRGACMMGFHVCVLLTAYIANSAMYAPPWYALRRKSPNRPVIPRSTATRNLLLEASGKSGSLAEFTLSSFASLRTVRSGANGLPRKSPRRVILRSGATKNLLLRMKKSRCFAALSMTSLGDFHAHWWAEGPCGTRNDR
jgi:hypothetical protein